MSLPTKYTILHDTIGEDLFKIETLTYRLCYLYFNVCGSVNVPAPIIYAHKLANLVADKNE